MSGIAPQYPTHFSFQILILASEVINRRISFLTTVVTKSEATDKIAAAYSKEVKVAVSCHGSTAVDHLPPLLHLDSQGTADSFSIAPNAEDCPASSSTYAFKEELLQVLADWEIQGLFGAVTGHPEEEEVVCFGLSTLLFLYYTLMFGLYLVAPLFLLAVTAATLFGHAYIVFFVICFAADCLMLVLTFAQSWKFRKQCIEWCTGLTMVIGGCILWPFAFVALVVCIPFYILPLFLCPNELKEAWTEYRIIVENLKKKALCCMLPLE